MNVDDLQVLLELSRTGRLRDVARRLTLDETTVSRKIGRLEQELGARLVDRDRRGWRLTATGWTLLPHAEAIEAEREAITGALPNQDRTLSGTVRVLAPDGFGVFALIPSLGPLRQTHPGVEVEVFTSTTHDAATARDFDLAITLERTAARAASVRKLTNYYLRLYASTAYLATHGAPQNLRQFRDGHTLIWYIDSVLDVEPLRILGSHITDARAQIQTNNIAGQLQAARHGLGIAPLPAYIGSTEPDLVPILADEFTVTRTYWLTIPDSTAHLTRVSAVLHSIHALINDRPDVYPHGPGGDGRTKLRP